VQIDACVSSSVVTVVRLACLMCAVCVVLCPVHVYCAPCRYNVDVFGRVYDVNGEAAIDDVSVVFGVGRAQRDMSLTISQATKSQRGHFQLQLCNCCVQTPGHMFLALTQCCFSLKSPPVYLHRHVCDAYTHRLRTSALLTLMRFHLDRAASASSSTW
jgi:hypothetical protein